MTMMLPLAKISFWWTLFAAVWALLALGLILIVLLQKGRGGGIGAAFGGGGGTNSLLGTKTGDFLTWLTICLVALFLIGAVVMGKYMRPSTGSGLVPVQATQGMPGMPAEGELPADEAVTPDDAAASTEQGEQTAEAAAQETQAPADQAAETAETPAKTE